MGKSRLAKVQLGLEATPGALQAASTVWRGMGWIDNQFVNVFPKENVGVLTDTDRSYIPYLLAQVKLDSTPLTFEQLPYILDAGISVATPVEDGDTGYIYTYLFPTDTVLTPSTYSIEGGDDTQAEVVTYGICTDFELSGNVKEAWMMSANFTGRSVTKQAYTGAVAIPDVTEAIFLKSLLYAGAVAGDWTGLVTPISSTIKKLSFKCTTGWFDDPTADGELYYTQASFDPDKFRASLDVTFIHNSDAVTEKDAWVAQSTRIIKVVCSGAAITGDVYDYKTLEFDLVGRWERFNTLEMSDGSTLVTGTFVSRFSDTITDPTQGAGFIVVVNELDALP